MKIYVATGPRPGEQFSEADAGRVEYVQVDGAQDVTDDLPEVPGAHFAVHPTVGIDGCALPGGGYNVTCIETGLSVTLFWDTEAEAIAEAHGLIRGRTPEKTKALIETACSCGFVAPGVPEDLQP